MSARGIINNQTLYENISLAMAKHRATFSFVSENRKFSRIKEQFTEVEEKETSEIERDGWLQADNWQSQVVNICLN